MQVVYECCAGLDIHKKTVVACCKDGKKGQEIKTFGTTTPDLLELVDWLLAWGCTHVAMESTGGLLEGTFVVFLVNAQHVKHVPGRKTDVKDAEWLTDLLQHGLLKASFIPEAPQRDLRDLTRYRTNQVQERSRQVNRLQKLLESANIKLSSLATDILGVSGRAILESLIEGHSDPETMAEMAKGRMRSKVPELRKALTGVVRDHHSFLLAELLSHIDFLDERIASVSSEIQRRIGEMSQAKISDKGDTHELSHELSPLPPDEAVTLLDTIPGVDKTIAEVIVAELGTNMSQFPSSSHAASWAGLSPGNHQSGGKVGSGRIKPGNRILRSRLVQAAWAASHTKDTYLSAQYRSLSGRRGRKRAIVAVAHSILVIAYHMLKSHQPYHELGGNYFDDRKKETIIHRLTKRLVKLGYEVDLKPVAV